RTRPYHRDRAVSRRARRREEDFPARRSRERPRRADRSFPPSSRVFSHLNPSTSFSGGVDETHDWIHRIGTDGEADGAEPAARGVSAGGLEPYEGEGGRSGSR